MSFEGNDKVVINPEIINSKNIKIEEKPTKLLILLKRNINGKNYWKVACRFHNYYGSNTNKLPLSIG